MTLLFKVSVCVACNLKRRRKQIENLGEQKGGGGLDLSEILTNRKKFLVMVMYT